MNCTDWTVAISICAISVFGLGAVCALVWYGVRTEEMFRAAIGGKK